MKKIFACAISALLLVVTGWASDKDKDQDRLKNAGTVLTEILNMPDNIPQDLLDKADCVVVFPSVLKAAFVVGVTPEPPFAAVSEAAIRARPRAVRQGLSQTSAQFARRSRLLTFTEDGTAASAGPIRRTGCRSLSVR